MEFQPFGYCYVLVFAMKMELVAVIIMRLLLSLISDSGNFA